MKRWLVEFARAPCPDVLYYLTFTTRFLWCFLLPNIILVLLRTFCSWWRGLCSGNVFKFGHSTKVLTTEFLLKYLKYEKSLGHYTEFEGASNRIMIWVKAASFVQPCLHVVCWKWLKHILRNMLKIGEIYLHNMHLLFAELSRIILGFH